MDGDTMSSQMPNGTHLLWPFLPPLVVVPAMIYVYRDFQSFLALGPGGTPSTVAGYIKIKLIGLLTISDQYTMNSTADQPGQLIALPDRGLRPVTRGIAPHRQMTQRASAELYSQVKNAMASLCSSSKDLRSGTSFQEKHSMALFSTSARKLTCDGEVCHIHPLDGSMHLTLHPADAKLVLDSRWGERHPLAREDKLAYFVPKTFLMVYAPRTEADVAVLMLIVKAAAWYVGGKHVDGNCQEMVDLKQ